MWNKYLKDNSIRPSRMTKQQAYVFLNKVKSSRNPAIRNFLERVEKAALKRLEREAFERGEKFPCKAILKKLGKGGLRKFPIVTAGWFVWDFYQGGADYAFDELVWPL